MTTTEIVTELHTHPLEMKYLVQVSSVPTPKSVYRTWYVCSSELQGLMYYRGINIGGGYKKRLLAVSVSGQRILYREFS